MFREKAMEEHTDHIQTYKKVKVNTAHPIKIIVMLYDEALRQIDVALREIEIGLSAYDKVNKALAKTKDIFTELTIALNMKEGGDIARELFRLYDFFNDQLSIANTKKSAEPLKQIRPMVVELRESWMKISHETPQNMPAIGGIDISG